MGGMKRVQKYAGTCVRTGGLTPKSVWLSRVNHNETGAWMDGMMHGHGTYWWKNGDAWEGTFIRNELHGKVGVDWGPHTRAVR